MTLLQIKPTATASAAAAAAAAAATTTAAAAVAAAVGVPRKNRVDLPVVRTAFDRCCQGEKCVFLIDHLLYTIFCKESRFVRT